MSNGRLCFYMLLLLLAFLRRPRATNPVHHHHARLQRIHADFEVVIDGLRRGDISVEDLGE